MEEIMQTSAYDTTQSDGKLMFRGAVWVFRCCFAGLLVLFYLLHIQSSVLGIDVLAHNGVNEEVGIWLMLIMIPEYIIFLSTAYFMGAGAAPNQNIYQQWWGGMRKLRLNILYMSILRIAYPFVVQSAFMDNLTADRPARVLVAAPPLHLLLILPFFMFITTCAAAGLAVAFGILARSARGFRFIVILIAISVASLVLLALTSPVPHNLWAIAVSAFDAGTKAAFPFVSYQILEIQTGSSYVRYALSQEPVQWLALLVPFLYLPLTALVLMLARRVFILPAPLSKQEQAVQP
jgi:hypothetical protein